ncbi:MAG: hypothetical protein ACP5NX_02470 [Candidatus Bilamarchaeaceae archaeon]
MGISLPNIYKGNYKLLIAVPLVLILLSLFFATHVKLGVDFSGGTLVSLNLNKPVDAATLQASLADAGFAEAKVRAYETAVGYKAEIEFPQSRTIVRADQLKSQFTDEMAKVSELEAWSNSNESYFQEYLEERKKLNAIADEMFQMAGLNTQAGMIDSLSKLQKEFSTAYMGVYSQYTEGIKSAIGSNADYSSISVQTVSPALSAKFMDDALNIIFWAAVLSIIFIFAFFRSIVPSFAVLLGAFCDVLFAIGAMGLFGIPLTLASFAALLMLVGFSLDTDILLTMRMLKRKGDPRENAHDAMKTGLTMSVAAIISFSALFILGLMTRISTYYEISAVALAGLVGDVFATWFLNAVIMIYYVEKKQEKV